MIRLAEQKAATGKQRTAMSLMTPLLLFVFLLAQNGLMVVGLAAKWSGHQVANSWHFSHYDVVVGEKAPVSDTASLECAQAEHMDFKPFDLVTLGKVLMVQALLPALLLFFFFLTLQLFKPRCYERQGFIHRNTVSCLIRSTVLRH